MMVYTQGGVLNPCVCVCDVTTAVCVCVCHYKQGGVLCVSVRIRACRCQLCSCKKVNVKLGSVISSSTQMEI